MSPRRLSPRSNTFNYSEDTLEIARLHIAQAHCSSRKRQSRAGTTKLSSSQPIDSPYRRTLSRVCSNAWLALLGAIDRNGDVESRGRRCQIDGRLCRTNIRFQRQSVSLQKRLKVTVERLLQRRYRPAAFATL